MPRVDSICGLSAVLAPGWRFWEWYGSCCHQGDDQLGGMMAKQSAKLGEGGRALPWWGRRQPKGGLTWVAGAMVALWVWSCGGKSKTEAPADAEPIDEPAQFCEQMARQHCQRAISCCGFDGEQLDVEACLAARLTDYSSEPDDYDARAAGQCVAYDEQAHQECAALPASDSLAVAYRKSCEQVASEPELSGTCYEDAQCPEDPERIILCDSRTDGVGSLNCYDAGARRQEGDTCSQDRECEPELVCAITSQEGTRSECMSPRPAGAPCNTDTTCSSGHCECEGTPRGDPDCYVGATGVCSEAGPPVLREGDCALLSALGDALLIPRELQQSQPHAVAVDATHVYWGEAASVYRAEKSSGDGIELLHEGDERAHYSEMPHALATDDTHAYFHTASSLVQLDKQGGGVVKRWDASEAYAMLLLGDEVVLARLGCEIARVATDQEGEVTFSATLEPEGYFVSLAADDAWIYCMSRSSIWGYPREGGEPELILAADAAVGPLVSDGSTLVWGNADHSGIGEGELRSMTLPEGDVVSLAPASRPMTVLLYDEGRDRYYWTHSLTELETYDVAMDQVASLDVPAGRGLAQDADALYFTNEYGVMRLLKDL